MSMLSRRELLRNAALGMAALPTLSFARAETESRFVLLILRGAVDGLAVAPPFGDGNYQKLRGELALPVTAANKLDGLFGLHPSLATVRQAFAGGEALVMHAIASPYRRRSHFDGQDVLENGGATEGAIRDGWLNRAIGHFGTAPGNEQAIALSPTTPLVLRGDNSVTSWAPSRLPDADESTLERLQDLYANDAFFATRLAQALTSQEIAGGMDGLPGRQRSGNPQLESTMSTAARFLTSDNGPRIAVVEASGWDTHANQGAATGQLANRLGALDTALAAMKSELGAAWANTVIAVVTEFGRTVRVNGTRGTDHGTGTTALLLGGAVNGGRVIADWPGLRDNDLYENRDLRPTLDIRSLFKGVLADHLAVPELFLQREVFPDSAAAPALRDLIRSS
jgi:uncharacterized protein (DUF1501 family)